MEVTARPARDPRYPPAIDGYPPEVPPAPLKDRVTPQQLLLGAGVVAVLGAALSTFSVGTPIGVGTVTLLLLVAAALAVLAGYAGGPTAGEALAIGAVAAAGALVVVGAGTAPRPALAAATLAGFVSVAAAALTAVSPQLRTWPIASWLAFQVTVLVVVRSHRLPPVLLGAVLLGVALVGLTMAWLGEGTRTGPVSTAGLLGSVPWWAAGVWTVEGAAWTGVQAHLAGGLGVGAALGLLLTTHHRVPTLPLLGPAVPVIAGFTAGTAVAGAAVSAGPEWVLGSGFLGLGLAALVAVAAARGPAWVPRDAGLAAAVTLTLLAAVGTAWAARWADLGLLLVTTAAAAVLLSVRDRDSRPSTVPIAVGAGALAIVMFTSEGQVSGAAVGAALVAVSVAALAEAVVLAVVLPWRERLRVRSWVHRRAVTRSARVDDVRDAFDPIDTGRSGAPLPVEVPAAEIPETPASPDERAATSAAGTGSVVGLLGVGTAAASGAWGVTALLLAAFGLAAMGHGDVARARSTRVLGGLALVAAAWVGAAQLGWSAPEVVTVPAGVVLLAGSWRALRYGPSWPSWGPGLAVGLLPSVALTLVDPTPLRQVLALVAALVCVLAGLGWAVRAPFLLGVVGVLGVSLGWLLDGAPTAWAVVLFAVGVLLLAVGAARERQRRRGDPVPARVRTLR